MLDRGLSQVGIRRGDEVGYAAHAEHGKLGCLQLAMADFGKVVAAVLSGVGHHGVESPLKCLGKHLWPLTAPQPDQPTLEIELVQHGM